MLILKIRDKIAPRLHLKRDYPPTFHKSQNKKVKDIFITDFQCSLNSTVIFVYFFLFHKGEESTPVIVRYTLAH